RQGFVHRVDRRRPARDGARGVNPEEMHAGVRGKVGEYRPGRRRYGARRGRSALCDLLSSGPVLRSRDAIVPPRKNPRRITRQGRGEDQENQTRRPEGPEDRYGPAYFGTTA